MFEINKNFTSLFTWNFDCFMLCYIQKLFCIENEVFLFVQRTQNYINI